MKRGDILPPSKFREDFAPLREEFPVCYLDNACTTMRPDSVVDAVTSYYTKGPGCGGRSPHRWGNAVTQNVVQAREKIAKFIGASRSEIVFTLNSTAGINQIARGINWKKGDVVITSDKEHNSNFVPWLQLKNRGLINHEIVNSNLDRKKFIVWLEELISFLGNGYGDYYLNYIYFKTKYPISNEKNHESIFKEVQKLNYSNFRIYKYPIENFFIKNEINKIKNICKEYNESETINLPFSSKYFLNNQKFKDEMLFGKRRA